MLPYSVLAATDARRGKVRVTPTRSHACLSALLTLATTGISELTPGAEGATIEGLVRHHLQSLFAYALAKITDHYPGRDDRRIALFVGATGGMRALRNQARKLRIEAQARAVSNAYMEAPYDGAQYDNVGYQTIPVASRAFLAGWLPIIAPQVLASQRSLHPTNVDTLRWAVRRCK